MTALAANITDAQTLIPVDAGLTNGTFQLPLYYTVDSEAIRVTGRAHRITWLVERGIAGTTAASHSSAATLTRYYPEAATSGEGGGAIAVTDGDTTVEPSSGITFPVGSVIDAGGGIAEVLGMAVNESGAFRVVRQFIVENDGGLLVKSTDGTTIYLQVHEAGITLNFDPLGVGPSLAIDANGITYFDSTGAQLFGVTPAGGGNAWLYSGAGGIDVIASGGVVMSSLPTADPVNAGELWIDPAASFVVKQSQG